MYLVYRHWKTPEEDCTIIPWLFYEYEKALEKANEEINDLLSYEDETDKKEKFVVDADFDGFSNDQICNSCIVFYKEQNNWNECVEITIERVEPQ